MTTAHTITQSPIGPLTLATRGDALSGLYMDTHRGVPAHVSGSVRDDSRFEAPLRWLERYFAGDPAPFELPLDLSGTPFQLRVWKALTEIPYGETISYGELARRVGAAGKARAVGTANARNPVSIVVPCHRVIGADGSLTGYGGGLERKRTLLDLEGGRLALPA